MPHFSLQSTTTLDLGSVVIQSSSPCQLGLYRGIPGPHHIPGFQAIRPDFAQRQVNRQAASARNVKYRPVLDDGCFQGISEGVQGVEFVGGGHGLSNPRISIPAISRILEASIKASLDSGK